MNIIFSSESKLTVSNDTKSKLQAWNLADYTLFEAVNSTFWEKISAYGIENVENEIKTLKALVNERMDFCVSEISFYTKKEMMEQCPGCKTESKMQKYVLTEEGKQSESCLYLTMSAIDFTNHIWQRQNDKFKQLEASKAA